MFYIEQLVKHAQPQLKEKHPRKKLLQNLQPLAKVLKDLEVDLRTNPKDSWVEEFVNTPNHGHVALIDLIKDLADNPYSVPRKNPKKYAVLDREPVSFTKHTIAYVNCSFVYTFNVYVLLKKDVSCC